MNRKQITLPSGGTCTVRKVSQNDYLASGLMPVFLRFAKMSKAELAKRSTEATEEEQSKAIQHLASNATMKLLRCCGRITMPNGEKFKITDSKPVDDCAADEITIDELDQADAEVILDAIDTLSGLKKEAAQAAARFPEGQELSGGDSPAGDGLQVPSDGVTGPEPV